MLRVNKSRWRKIRTRLCCGLISLDVNKKTLRGNPLSREDDISSDDVDSDRVPNKQIEMTLTSNHLKQLYPFKNPPTPPSVTGRHHGGPSLSKTRDSRETSQNTSIMNTPSQSFICRENTGYVDVNQIHMNFKEHDDIVRDWELSEPKTSHSTPARYVGRSQSFETSPSTQISSFTRTNLHLHQNQFMPFSRTVSNQSRSSDENNARKASMQSIHPPPHHNASTPKNGSSLHEEFYHTNRLSSDSKSRFSVKSSKRRQRIREKTSFDFYRLHTGNNISNSKFVESMEDNVIFRRDHGRKSKDDHHLPLRNNEKHVMLPFEDGDIPVNMNEKLKKDYHERKSIRQSSQNIPTKHMCDNITTSDDSLRNLEHESDATILSPDSLHDDPFSSSTNMESISISERI